MTTVGINGIAGRMGETIYETANMETLYRIFLLGEDEEAVLALSDEELLSE